MFLTPAHHQFFIAEVETVLEIQQAGHQSNGQFGASSITATATNHRLCGAKHVLTLEHLADSVLMFELRRYCRLDLTPRQPCGQHRQRIVQIDHGVNAAAEKVDRLHTQIPQKVSLPLTFFEGFGGHDLHNKVSVHAG